MRFLIENEGMLDAEVTLAGEQMYSQRVGAKPDAVERGVIAVEAQERQPDPPSGWIESTYQNNLVQRLNWK